MDTAPAARSDEPGVLVRRAIDHQRDDPTGFPAIQRLALHSNLWAFLADW